jgi:hypothetical protein
MREATSKAIDALHAQIAELVEAEKRNFDAEHPNMNSLWRSISHTKIEFQAHSPQHRALMRVEAVATLPRQQKEKQGG